MRSASKPISGTPEYALAIRTKIGVILLVIVLQLPFALFEIAKNYADRSWVAYFWMAIAAVEVVFACIGIMVVARMRRAMR